MLEVNFKAPTLEAIQFIADNMREADVAEVWASGRYTPLEALEVSVKNSKKSAVAYVDDVPLVIFGVVSRGFLSDVGVPWMLSVTQSMKYKRQFFELSPQVVDDMLNVCPKLVNRVHTKNKLSIRWLKWLGFTIEDPKPIKATGELFHKFHMER